MPDQLGTIEQLLRHLSEALQPLADELSPALLQDVGIGIPAAWSAQLDSEFAHVSSAARALTPATNELITAAAGGNAVAIIARSAALGIRIAELAATAIQLGATIRQAANADGSLSAAQKAHFDSSVDQLFARLTELMAVRTLERQLPQLAAILDLLGVFSRTVLPGVPGDPTAPPHIRRGLALNNVVTLFENPNQLARELYGWSDPTFDGRELLTKLRGFLRSYELPAEIIDLSGQPPILESLIIALQANTSVAPPGLGFELRLPATAAVNQTWPLVGPWSLLTTFQGTFAAGLQGLIETDDFQVQPPTGSVDVTAGAFLVAHRADRAMQIIGLPGGTRLEVDRVTAGLEVRAVLDSSTGTAAIAPVVTIALDRMKLILSLSGGDGFLKDAIPTSAIEAEFSLAGRLSQDGFAVTGSGRIEVLMPTHIVLGPLEIQSICFVAKLFDPDPVKLELSAGLKFSLGPLVAVVERMGATGAFKLPAAGDGNAGPVQFELGFKPPEGVGLSIDAGAVRGGGYLFFNFEQQEYAGVMQLNLLDMVSITAIALITTRMPDGSDGFSLLVIITVEFTPGIQLGYGFSLIGLGGLIGLNRTMMLEPLMVGVRNGTIASIMFPQGDIIANAPRIISDLRAIFPPYQGKFLIGPMAKIGWGTPVLISVSLGIIIEIPGNIAIVGVLRLALPTPAETVINLQVAFAGAIEFDKKRLFFFASLFESRILFITLDGEMGLLLGWGDDPAFVFTVGGFHPRFTPPPLPFPSPTRLALCILNEESAMVRVQLYFAVTSNTVQVGAHAELRFGFDDFGIQGHLGFDALFQFSPFYFIIEVNISLSLNIFGLDVLSVRVELSLEGPTPWRARGTGHVSFLFFTFSADFDVTWGDSAETTLPPITIVPLILAEFDKRENWTASLPPGNNLLVSLRGGTETAAELVMHPLGMLRVTQRLLPLALPLDKVGTQKPSDAKRFEILVTGGGLEKKGDVREKFAMAQFLDMSDAEKLSRPSYQPGTGGLDLGAAGAQLATSHMARRKVRYEEILIDGEFKRHQKKSIFSTGLFAHHLKGSTITTSRLSAAHQNRFNPFGDDRVTVPEEAYTIVHADTNRAFAAAVPAGSFSSEAEARDHLAQFASANPAEARKLQIVPAWEVAA
jgi:hypothetical protein